MIYECPAAVVSQQPLVLSALWCVGRPNPIAACLLLANAVDAVFCFCFLLLQLAAACNGRDGRGLWTWAGLQMVQACGQSAAWGGSEVR
jgi:hypothetical protein